MEYTWKLHVLYARGLELLRIVDLCNVLQSPKDDYALSVNKMLATQYILSSKVLKMELEILSVSLSFVA